MRAQKKEKERLDKKVLPLAPIYLSGRQCLFMGTYQVRSGLFILGAIFSFLHSREYLTVTATHSTTEEARETNGAAKASAKGGRND